MIKKIKDLTIIEYMKFCNSQRCCSKCPLWEKIEYTVSGSCTQEVLLDKTMQDMEVEIEND